MSVLAIMLFVDKAAIHVQASSTYDKLKQEEKEREAKENQADKAQDKIDNLENQQSGLQTELANLNQKLTDISQRLEDLESMIEQKEAEIATTQLELDEARAVEKTQYEDMKSRIRFMYEKGNTAYVELLLSSKDYAQFLNMNEYVTKLTEYDRKMLLAYKELKEKIEKKEADLKQEKIGLSDLMKKAAVEQGEVQIVLDKVAKEVETYESQISAEEKRLINLEKEMASHDTNIISLKQQLEAEIELSRQSSESQKRDLSDVTFEGGDIDLLAAIIECEAGGEIYEGKVAVGAVVMNRVKSPVFPDTVVGVIYAPRQFSPVASGRLAVVLARGANATCYQAAQDAMAGVSPVGECVFFRTPIEGLSGIRIGGHIFY